MSSHRILVINGPNLNLLGRREPEVYGSMTLNELNKLIENHAVQKQVTVEFFQSNHEGGIIDFLHNHYQQADGLLINPGAYTHYSYAIRDAIAGIEMPAVEVHLSDIYSREPFRKVSVIAPVCIQQISGLGKDSYLQGLDFLLNHLKQ